MRKNRRPQRPVFEGFIESYSRGSDRLREAVGEFMQPGPGKYAGDASGKMAYQQETPGGQSKGARTGGGIAKGYRKGDVQVGKSGSAGFTGWDTDGADHARHASMRCSHCGAENIITNREARAFRCHACEGVTRMSQLGESFRRSYHQGESDMQRQVSEAAAVRDGMCHDEAESRTNEHDSRRGASDGYPVDDDDDEEEDEMGRGIGFSSGEDEDEAQTGEPRSVSPAPMRVAEDEDEAMTDEARMAEDEDEEESRPMRASFKCAQCSEKVMHPMMLARMAEDEVSSPAVARCRKGHKNSVAPPAGYRFTQNAQTAESVRSFFVKYLRECSGQRSGGFMG